MQQLTLKEQIANKCIHFTGVMNDTCNAGIKYADVRTNDRPYKFPCLCQGGECASRQLLTEEEVEQEVKEILGIGTHGLIASLAVKAHYEKTKQDHGKIKCPCDQNGELAYAVASNGHIRVHCSTCKLSLME